MSKSSDCYFRSAYTSLHAYLWEIQKSKGQDAVLMEDLYRCLVMRPGLSFTVGTTVGEILEIMSKENRIKCLETEGFMVNDPTSFTQPQNTPEPSSAAQGITSADQAKDAGDASLRRTLITEDGRGPQVKRAALEELLRRAREVPSQES